MDNNNENQSNALCLGKYHLIWIIIVTNKWVIIVLDLRTVIILCNLCAGETVKYV